MTESPQTLARTDGVGGEVVLRRRDVSGEPVYELIVNGTFAMDSVETSTERLLAEAVLDRHPSPRRVFVGGLGLGFTLRALLADPRVEHVHVVELEPALVDWLGSGLVPGADTALSDARVTVSIDDVRSALAQPGAGQYDGVLLDVDNGPDFLVHQTNASVYRRDQLDAAARTLRAGGILAIWSATGSERLRTVLRELDALDGEITELVQTVTREGRELDYHLYLARRPEPAA